MQTLRLANTEMTATIDDLDLEAVLGMSWRLLKNRRDGRAHKFYAQNGQGKLLHRILLCPDPGILVDHIDGNGLNCVRENMRLATRSQNAMNRGPQRNNTSGFKGVYYHKNCDKWSACYKLNQKNVTIGFFDTAEQANAALVPVRALVFGDFDHGFSGVKSGKGYTGFAGR